MQTVLIFMRIAKVTAYLAQKQLNAAKDVTSKVLSFAALRRLLLCITKAIIMLENYPRKTQGEAYFLAC